MHILYQNCIRPTKTEEWITSLTTSLLDRISILYLGLHLLLIWWIHTVVAVRNLIFFLQRGNNHFHFKATKRRCSTGIHHDLAYCCWDNRYQQLEGVLTPHVKSLCARLNYWSHVWLELTVQADTTSIHDDSDRLTDVSRHFPHLCVKEGQSFGCMQRDEHLHQKLLVLGFQRQCEPVDDTAGKKKTARRYINLTTASQSSAQPLELHQGTDGSRRWEKNKCCK